MRERKCQYFLKTNLKMNLKMKSKTNPKTDASCCRKSQREGLLCPDGSKLKAYVEKWLDGIDEERDFVEEILNYCKRSRKTVYRRAAYRKAVYGITGCLQQEKQRDYYKQSENLQHTKSAYIFHLIEKQMETWIRYSNC